MTFADDLSVLAAVDALLDEPCASDDLGAELLALIAEHRARTVRPGRKETT